MSIANYTGYSGAPIAHPYYPGSYTRVDAGTPGGKTTVHAVLDYDDDLGGEIAPDANIGQFLVNNNYTDPAIPVYPYPPVPTNSSLLQIPVLWTALALGLVIRGDVIRGSPCIKRYHQLFCPTAGNTYPIERIEEFIDQNKALMKRMYGEFEMSTEYGPPGEEVYESERNTGGGRYRGRNKRQSFPANSTTSDTGRLDACQSKVEIVTPYWAANSAGKIRALVNTQHFEQAIHQEVCSKVQTNRCGGDCGCEQKYKWHRLLAYDPDNDCKGIFMDWFLFPSCCVCRCQPGATNSGIFSPTRDKKPMIPQMPSRTSSRRGNGGS